MPSRFSLALSGAYVALPEAGHILVLRPEGDFDFGPLELARVRVEQVLVTDHARLSARGVEVSPTMPEGPFAAAVVCVSKAKAETLDLLARACSALPKGAPIVVDGDKAQGIESVLKLCRKIADVGPAFSKAHGKTFAFTNPGVVPQDWAARSQEVEGYTTRPGVFSFGEVDPGSRALIAALPELKGEVCDLGAGWGYLAAEVLKAAPKVTTLDLVEADWTALACAKDNVSDPRAAFHWADARHWTGRYDTVISNPPFHTGRHTTPGLGQAFITRASQILQPRGQFIMVANRHLPYETTLAEAFTEVVVMAEVGGYKVISARRPNKR